MHFKHTVEIHTTHPRKTSSPMNFCNFFDTSVLSLWLKILVLCFGLMGLERSKQIPSLFTFFTRSFHDQMIGNGIVVASSLSDGCLVIIFVTPHLKQKAMIRLIRLSDYQRKILPMFPGINIYQNQ